MLKLSERKMITIHNSKPYWIYGLTPGLIFQRKPELLAWKPNVARHFTVPYIPDIPGVCSFDGIITHSHWYKHPSRYQGKNVIVVGAASSGEDISLEIASVADIVILSFKNPPKPTSLPSNIHQRSPIKEVDNDGRVVFDDGSVFKVDIIVFCTGYLYEFPFLAPECKIKVKNKRVFPLYKHLFNIIYPSMAFLGLTRHGLTIPVFHLQAQFVVCVLSGKKTLPTQSEMEIDTDNEIKDRSDIGLPEKHFHSLGERRWEYFRAISMLSGCEPVSKLVKNIYHEIIHQRKTNLLNYKTGNYKELNNEEFIELEPKLERKELPASYTAIFGTKCPCPCPNCSSSFNLN